MLLIILLATASFSVPSAGAAPKFSTGFTDTNPDCQSVVSQLSDDSTIRFLTNPILTTPDQIAEAVRVYSQAQECLQSIPRNEMTAILRDVDLLSKYLLIFITENNNQTDQSKLELVDFAHSDSPAVIRLRDEIGLPIPPGYVFIRYYAARSLMPELVGQAFSDPQVAGVTILGRYIAILEEPKSTWEENLLQSETLAGTYHHELVHAYVNSILLDHQRTDRSSLPKWFEEGLANYLSGSGKVHTVVSSDLTLSQTTSAEYRRYQLYFEYLESRYGEETLNTKIREAVLAGNAELVYSDLGVVNTGQLDALAVRWRDRWILTRSAVGGLGLALILGFLYSRLPEYECICGFSGRRRKFSANRCPNCGRQFAEAQKKPARSSLLIAPACQICGARFAPWQHSQLAIHRHAVRIWLPARAGTDIPQTVTAKRVCQNCTTRSRQVHEEYSRQLENKMAQFKTEIRPNIAAWLSNAPPVRASSWQSWQVYPFNDLLNLLVSSWLEQQFGLSSGSLSEFTIATNNFPEAFQNILIHNENHQIGSIFKLDQNLFVLEWRQIT